VDRWHTNLRYEQSSTGLNQSLQPGWSLSAQAAFGRNLRGDAGLRNRTGRTAVEFRRTELHSNSGMYYYLHRFYDPSLQRWINRDPIGEKGSANLYGFVANTPINRLDPLGLRDLGCRYFNERAMGWHPGSDKDFYTSLAIFTSTFAAAGVAVAAADAFLTWIGVGSIVASSPQGQEAITTVFNAQGITDTTIMVNSPQLGIWWGTTTGTYLGGTGLGPGTTTITGSGIY
jgi:RHS repeat-associated protein